MAQKVNLRESEYRMIVSELAQMHASTLEYIYIVIARIKILVTSEDTFSTDLTSNKMLDMLDILTNDIVPLLKQAFRDSEAGVANMIKSIMATDSACD